ncbi:TPA: DNA methyltransferase [Neisseria meningitidis]
MKLIYIDPPYYFVKKKQQDSFGYNTNFKLSTWLTFMKNRLSIAKELLTDDGIIVISIFGKK